MKALIFIHGYLSNHEDFGSLPDELAPDYDDVYRLDLPGHGESARIREFTKKSIFALIDEELPRLISKYDGVDLIGFSLGGAIANYLAQFCNINKLVLLAPSVRYFSPLFVFRRFNFMRKAEPARGVIKACLLKPVEEIPGRLRYLVKYDLGAIKFCLKVTSPRFRVSNALLFTRIVRRLNKRNEKITCPTLVMWGYLDELVPYAAARDCYERCVNPNKELVVVPHIGHMMLRSSRAEGVKTKIKDFLRG